MIKEDVKAQGSLYILFLLYRKLLCFGIKCIPKGTLVWSISFPCGRGPLYDIIACSRSF